MVRCNVLILIQAPSCAYATRRRLVGSLRIKEPHAILVEYLLVGLELRQFIIN